MYIDCIPKLDHVERNGNEFSLKETKLRKVPNREISGIGCENYVIYNFFS